MLFLSVMIVCITSDKNNHYSFQYSSKSNKRNRIVEDCVDEDYARGRSRSRSRSRRRYEEYGSVLRRNRGSDSNTIGSNNSSVSSTNTH